MKRLGALIRVCVCIVLALAAPRMSAAADTELLRIEDVDVRVTLVGPVVLLKLQNKAIPVFVDSVVAESIHAVLTGIKTPRPLTHNLMHNILESFDGRVTQAVITLEDSTYRGALTVVMQGVTRVFDSRSSDAIALALHFKAPILVSQSLLDAQGKVLEQELKREDRIAAVPVFSR